MLKGNERRVVIIKGDRDAVYDMACIFMKSERRLPSEGDDIVKEAEKIINSVSFNEREEEEKKEPLFTKRILSFCVGVFSGCTISIGAYVLVCVLFFA